MIGLPAQTAPPATDAHRPTAHQRLSIDGPRAVALALPVVVPLAMVVTFDVSRARLGDQWGYVAGFGVYWATCAGLSVALLGRRRVRDLFRDVRPRLTRPVVVGVALLAWPAVGAITTRLIPEMGNATLAMVATILGVATANALLEEVMWRGVFITFWPRNPWLGWVWPAAGFAAWHFAPQVIHPSPMGPGVFVTASFFLGLSWGWVAFKTGGLRLVSISHVVTDGSGIRSALYFLGG
jgi:membrane protease YdiL (CAAX protease family)